MAVDSADTLSIVSRICLPECELVQAVHDGWAMIRAVEQERLDLVIADLDMTGMDGIEATARLSRRGKRVPVIILAAERASEFVEEAFEAGAKAYVVKADIAVELVLAVRAVAAGSHYVSRSCGGQ